MKIEKIITLLVALMWSSGVFADISIQATYLDKNGVEVKTTEDFSGEAPLHVTLESITASLPTTAQVEWHISNARTGTSITRYDETVVLDLVEAGITLVVAQVRDNNEILESASIRITISESVLQMPNAFSPNNDGINDKYQAKSTSKSIVEFHAYIFNRYGQKLYDWTDWNNRDGGWDGTYNGHPVKDGVYYVYVKARGADGIEYEIRRDVNLMRNFNVIENSNNP